MIARFAELLERLPLASGASARRRLLIGFLNDGTITDSGYGLAALLGALHLPRLSGKALRELAAARIDGEYFEISQEHVGDLTETLALLWPTQTGGDIAIGEIISAWQATVPNARRELAASWLDRLDDDGRRGLLALLGGKTKLAEAADVRAALAAWRGVPLGEIERCWASQTPPYTDLLAWLDRCGSRPSLAPGSYRPQEPPPPIKFAALPPPGDATLYWHWPKTGLPVQLIVDGGAARLYAQGGDDIGAQFPELLPVGGEPAFVRGDLVVSDESGRPSIAALKRRLRRAKVDAKLQQTLPVHLYLHDWSSDAWLARQGNLPLSAAPVCGDLLLPRNLAPPGADAVLAIPEDGGPWRRADLPPLQLTAALLYVEAVDDGYICTIGLLKDRQLVPVGKAVFSPGGEQAKAFAHWLKQNTQERFGPVRKVPALAVSISYRGSERAPRRRAGLTILGARIEGVPWDFELDAVASVGDA